jgi:flagellar brake protein
MPRVDTSPGAAPPAGRPATPAGRLAEDDYRVAHPVDAQALFEALIEQRTPVVLAAPNGSTLTLTLWAADATSGQVSFAAGGVLPQIQALLDAEEALAVAYLDDIKLQFEVQPQLLLRGGAEPLLQAQVHGGLHRFQRRNSFRVHTSSRTGPRVTLRHPGLPEMTLCLRILDLSIGGCALLLPDDVPELLPGTLIHGVQVELDPATAFVASLTLQHVMSGHGRRLGCAWHRLPPEHERSLQCFINQTQQQALRRALPQASAAARSRGDTGSSQPKGAP